MMKRIMILAALLILVSFLVELPQALAGEKTSPFLKWFRRVSHYPEKLVKETADTAVDTTKEAVDTVTGTASDVTSVATGELEKTKDVVMTPLEGTGQTVKTAIEGTVTAPVDAAKEVQKIE